VQLALINTFGAAAKPCMGVSIAFSVLDVTPCHNERQDITHGKMYVLDDIGTAATQISTNRRISSSHCRLAGGTPLMQERSITRQELDSCCDILRSVNCSRPMD
jgi:hypothetical protein